MSFPGKGKMKERMIALVIVVAPLLCASWALNSYTSRPDIAAKSFQSAILFVSLLMLTSFSYDTLKTILLLEEGRFQIFWRQIGYLIAYMGGYAICIVILAVLPNKLGWFDSFVGVSVFVVTLIFCYMAIKRFLNAVHVSISDNPPAV